MHTPAEPYVPLEEDGQEAQERAVLERYYARRHDEIRRGERLSEGFISLDDLRAIADGRAPWPERKRRERP